MLRSNRCQEVAPVEFDTLSPLSNSKKCRSESAGGNRQQSEVEYLLADFGSAERIGETEAARAISEGDMVYMPLETLQLSAMMSTNIEVKKIDIFSIGLILLQMMTGADLPLPGDSWTCLRKAEVLSQKVGETNYSQLLKELVLNCLNPSAIERPSASDLMNVWIRRKDFLDRSSSLKFNRSLSRRIQQFSSLSSTSNLYDTGMLEQLPTSKAPRLAPADAENSMRLGSSMKLNDIFLLLTTVSSNPSRKALSSTITSAVSS